MKTRLEFLMQYMTNLGVGRAIVTEYHKAREEGMDVIAVMAGDRQMDPDELGRVVEPVIRERRIM